MPELRGRGVVECHRCDRTLEHRSGADVGVSLAFSVAILVLLPPAVFLPLMASTIKHLVYGESRLVSSVPVIYSEVWFPFAFGFLFFAFLFSNRSRAAAGDRPGRDPVRVADHMRDILWRPPLPRANRYPAQSAGLDCDGAPPRATNARPVMITVPVDSAGRHRTSADSASARFAVRPATIRSSRSNPRGMPSAALMGRRRAAG